MGMVYKFAIKSKSSKSKLTTSSLVRLCLPAKACSILCIIELLDAERSPT